MKRGIICGAALITLCFVAGARAQDAADDARTANERAPLTAETFAYDVAGRVALAARLKTTALAGSPDAPERNSRIVIENRSANFYTYASGWAAFYGADGVRCGAGMWNAVALAPKESTEVDTPGLRLTCQPAAWRITASSLVRRDPEIIEPLDGTASPAANAESEPATPSIPPLEININGKSVPIQLGNPLEILVGKERVRIVLHQAP